MIFEIEGKTVVVDFQPDCTTVEAKIEGTTGSVWMSTVAYGGKAGTAEVARELAVANTAIALFLEKELRLAELDDPQAEIFAVANQLRKAYYDDDTATIDKSDHREQWFRMARAALGKKD